MFELLDQTHRSLSLTHSVHTTHCQKHLKCVQRKQMHSDRDNTFDSWLYASVNRICIGRFIFCIALNCVLISLKIKKIKTFVCNYNIITSSVLFCMLMKNMSERNKNITAAMIALAGVGVCYMLAKYRADILQQIRLLRYFRDRLRHQQVHIVTNAEDCRKVVNILKS